LEIEAEAERQREIESKKQEEEEKEKERLEKERQILIDNEISLLQDLRQKSELWHEANKLRKFLYEYEAQLEKDNQLTKENIELLHFGFQKVDLLDPLIQTEDELFSNIDPFKLLKLWK